MQVITQNRKANFNYEILDKYIAGMVLKGWQVKSAKAHNVSLIDAYAYFADSELYLRGAQIAPWSSIGNPEKSVKTEDIKLLLNRQELDRLHAKLGTKGLTLVPLKIFLERGLLKLELGLARGKKQYDKRLRVKEREEKREVKLDHKRKGNYF